MWLMFCFFIVSLLFCILTNVSYYSSLAKKGEDNVWILKSRFLIVMSMFLSSSIFFKDVFKLSEQDFNIQHLLCYVIGYALSFSIDFVIRDACHKKWKRINSKNIEIKQLPVGMTRTIKYLELAISLLFSFFSFFGACYLFGKTKMVMPIIAIIAGLVSVVFFVIKLINLIRDNRHTR